jgi:predicted DNA-binding protein
MTTDIRLTVLVPDDLRKRAKAAAALQGTSLSAIVRQALEDFLEEVEDVAEAEEVLARIKRGEAKVYSHEEVWADDKQKTSHSRKPTKTHQ